MRTTAVMAFSDKVAELYPWMMSRAMFLCGDYDEAEDLVGDTVMKMLTNEGKYDKSRELKPWILVVMRNTYITRINHLRLLEMVPINEDFNTYSASSASSLAEVRRILNIIRECARKSKTIECVLLYAKGFDYDEISSRLSIPVGTVRSRISNGRKMLSAMLDL